MRSSTSNPTVDSLEGDGELRVEQGRDSIWSGCQKAPYSAPSPPPHSGGQKGREKRLAIQQEGHETGQGCTGARAQEERRSQKDSGQGEGLPWWRSGQEPTCQYRGHRFDPWSRKIPHAMELLSLHANNC